MNFKIFSLNSLGLFLIQIYTSVFQSFQFKFQLFFSKCFTQCGLSPFHSGGIAYLNNPDSYAGWICYTPYKPDRLKDKRSDNVAAK